MLCAALATVRTAEAVAAVACLVVLVAEKRSLFCAGETIVGLKRVGEVLFVLVVIIF